MEHDPLRPSAIPSRDAAALALTDAVSSEPAVIAAWLFGSVASGAAGPLSDVDVGLLINRTTLDSADIAGRVTDALCRSLRTPRVDVVVLADAPIPLRYRIVGSGVPVVGRDEAALERFIVESVLHYLDFKPLRDRLFEIQRRAIVGKT